MLTFSFISLYLLGREILYIFLDDNIGTPGIFMKTFKWTVKSALLCTDIIVKKLILYNIKIKMNNEITKLIE
jgi:hypothetical protein